MKIFNTIKDLKKELDEQRKNGKTIGFVPTMGALHYGHLSLVNQAKRNCEYTVVSIFVNPTQFNDPKDFSRYPKMENEDLEKLQSVSVDAVFIPSVEEIYPEKDIRVFDFGNLDKVMEGKFRTGHFNGVAQVVSKLFDIVEPNKAFFGLKDFQQYTIIKEMVKKYMPHLKLEIIGCPIIREKDGLAMSSRNMLLSAEQRKIANVINESLTEAVKLSKQINLADVKQFVIDKINNAEFMKVEYFDIVNGNTLQSLNNWNDAEYKVGCVAAFCGEIRLIDNIQFL